MYCVKTTSTQSAIDALAEALESLDGLVVSQDFFDPLLDPPERAENLSLTAYAESQDLAEQATRVLAGLGYTSQIALLENRDWVAESQAGLPSVFAGPWRIHGSHESPSQARARWHLKIDANTAFGTGHHETTQGCLLAFEAIRKGRQFRQVLDLGTGTGVLALAAKRRGATRVVASDIDPEAVVRSKQNAQNNALKGLHFIEATGMQHQAIRASAPYDLIFANILALPLIELAQPLSQALAPGGLLILAGLIKPQRQSVEAAYRCRGLSLVVRRFLGDWPTLVFQKGSKTRD